MEGVSTNVPQIGKYQLLKTLGAGAFSKVKLAYDKEADRYYALKLHYPDHPGFNATTVDIIANEILALKSIKHPNVINIIEWMQEAILEKPSGVKKKVVCVVVLELAEGGELFYFVKNSGFFSQEVSRFYFRSFIETLEHVHSNGLTHRDLKPDNLLFDREFNLKIADFGFAGPIQGRDGSGFLTTKLGTANYMAPEIHAG